ncbi:MAG: pentapeptide repeat-containing protein [Ktedonobacteraceae bacterium]
MSEQDSARSSTQQRPFTNDRDDWKAYWKAHGQPWRTEPEIDTEQQKYLAERCAITPNIEQGIYPFKDIKLNRADVEWLVATHENGRGPVDWSDESQRKREGLDLRGANLNDANLRHLPLARLQGGLTEDDWDQATPEQRYMAAIHLKRARLGYAHLEGSVLTFAQMQGADLYTAHLESIDAFGAHFEASVPANFCGVFFDAYTKLEQSTIANDKHVGIWLLDVQWGNVNLTNLDWSSVWTLYYEQRARSKTTIDGEMKSRTKRDKHYRQAVQAYRQLSVVLQTQGLNEDASRFAYRAQKLQRIVLRRQKSFGQYLFSLFLDGIAGYGYKPQRCLYVYFLAIIGFTIAHYFVGVVAGPQLTLLSALAVSVQSLHGRVFSFQPSDPQALINSIEAFVGLFIEAIIVAVITQRILGK